MMGVVAPRIMVAGVQGCMGLGGRDGGWTHGGSAGSTLLQTIGADWRRVDGYPFFKRLAGVFWVGRLKG